MKSCLVLFCFFVLSLQCADSCYSEGAFSHYRTAGENFSFPCILHSTETLKIFCKDDCEGENVLLKTREDKAQSGRYKTEYDGGPVLTVGITHLTKSDSGQYRCAIGTSMSSGSFIEFQLRVTDAVLAETTDGQEKDLSAEPGSLITVACYLAPSGDYKYFCRGACEENTLVQTQEKKAHRGRYSIEYDIKSSYEGVLLVTITDLTQSDSGQYRCYQDGPKTSFIHFNITVTQAVQPSTSRPPTIQTFPAFDLPAQMERGRTNPQVPLSHLNKADFPLIVGVSMAVPVVLLSAALLVSRRRRSLRGLKTRGGMNGSVVEIVIDDDDPTYQSLNPASMDQNQIYSELTQPK